MVVYGGEGVCRVEGVGTPSLPGMDKTRLYYTLAPLYRSGQVMTPVDTRVLMRPLLTGQEVQELIAQLASCRRSRPKATTPGPSRTFITRWWPPMTANGWRASSRGCAAGAAGPFTTGGRSARWTSAISGGRRTHCTASWGRCWAFPGRTCRPISARPGPSGRCFELSQKDFVPFGIKGLQTEKNFRPGTRPGRKWIAFDLPPAGGKFCVTIRR